MFAAGVLLAVIVGLVAALKLRSGPPPLNSAPGAAVVGLESRPEEAPEAPADAVSPLPVIRLSRTESDAAAPEKPSGAEIDKVRTRAARPYVPRSTLGGDLGSETPAPTTETEIDRILGRRLQELNIEPAGPCTDAEFLRRVSLDVAGTLPTADEARDFLYDVDPDKRRRLIDELLESPECAEYWAMRWCDVLRVKAEFPVNLWPNAAQAYHRWVLEALRDNLPYDEFARALLTSSGSNFRTPPVNFYRAVQSREPEALARVVALTFMGERAETWPPEKLQAMAVFFSQVGYKATGEWKEEIVLHDPRKARKGVGTEQQSGVLPDGSPAAWSDGQDPRLVFADWLIDGGNPRFVHPMVNRVWTWLMGRGLVSPGDEFSPGNPPSHPELLEHLAEEFVAADFDVRALARLILNSAAYQRSARPAHSDAEASQAAFASCCLRRLDAEVLIDAICQITGTTESYSSMIPEPFTFLPDGQRAIALPDGSISSPFLQMFGRPARDTGLENERSNRLSAAQALHLLNSNHIRAKIENGATMRSLRNSRLEPERVVEELSLSVLSRLPTAEERRAFDGSRSPEEGYAVLLWGMINSDEFLFRH